MALKPQGGFAFPHAMDLRIRGMTMRDYFAARALPGVVATMSDALDLRKPVQGHAESVAKAAYHLADAMIKARD